MKTYRVRKTTLFDETKRVEANWLAPVYMVDEETEPYAEPEEDLYRELPNGGDG